ncbi:hypothetical protein TcYC6_0071710 [Trypanosoma cruzi]|nr:hypothetical protein TcYC6_0071710 [Trypanosoma cruzi]
MLLFKRPHLRACESHADIAVDLAPLSQLRNYAEFEELLREELQKIYGNAPAEFHGVITYSTRDAPHSFRGCFTERQLETLHQYEAAVDKINHLSSEYRMALEEHERLVEGNKDRKPTQKRIREEEKSRKRLRAMKREVVAAEYNKECLSLKLKNLFSIDVIRVPLH